MTTEITCPPALLVEAARMAEFRKLNPQYRAMFTLWASGQAIDAEDLREGLFRAMRCTITSAGQSSQRRQSAEAVERLWDACFPHNPHTYVADLAAQPLFDLAPDLSDTEAVSEWLAS